MQRKLSDLSNKELLSLHHKITKQLIDSAHEKAREAVSHGVSAHAVEGDRTLAETLNQVRAVFEQRASRGELAKFAGKQLALGFRQLEKADRAANPKKKSARNSSAPGSLTLRETKIWEVIQRSVKGRIYCRELDNARIGPPRKGVWIGGPGTYLGAYDEGNPWRQRIQDEKSKIRRKAELAKHSLASKNSPLKKPA